MENGSRLAARASGAANPSSLVCKKVRTLWGVVRKQEGHAYHARNPALAGFLVRVYVSFRRAIACPVLCYFLGDLVPFNRLVLRIVAEIVTRRVDLLATVTFFALFGVVCIGELLDLFRVLSTHNRLLRNVRDCSRIRLDGRFGILRSGVFAIPR